MTPYRLVLDTSVLISALVFRVGSLVWLRNAWRSGTVRPLASRDTTTELIRVLHYPKFRLTRVEREDLMDDYLPRCETVPVPGSIEVPECHDPFDRPFLKLALVAGADALLTGDKDLPELAGSLSVPILAPAEFQRRLGSDSSANDRERKQG